jgi:hypothetical protein
MVMGLFIFLMQIVLIHAKPLLLFLEIGGGLKEGEPLPH